MIEDNIENLKKSILKEKKIVGELNSFFNYPKKIEGVEDRKMIISHLNSLKSSLKKTNENVLKSLEKIFLTKPLTSEIQEVKPKTETSLPVEKEPKPSRRFHQKLTGDLKPTKLEEETLKRIKKKEKKVKVKKEGKKGKYVKIANKLFSNLSRRLIKNKKFSTLKRDLVKSNLQIAPAGYISIILFTTLLSIFVALIIFLFFLFFNFEATLPIITKATEDIGIRFLKVFWILLLIPIITFLFAYLYPSLEKKSVGNKINQELPFATIHMAAISGSMLEPSRIFNIIITTKEYPNIGREFTKLINEINIYGYDLVTALRNSAFNSPSKKLSELFNGLATTINSGGDLPEFFEKRSESLLFEHKLGKEKRTKAAETFMDIYISIVIAAPMILMLLLMMMKISGLGISLSTSAITLIMTIGVSAINVVFLTFLHLRQPSE